MCVTVHIPRVHLVPFFASLSSACHTISHEKKKAALPLRWVVHNVWCYRVGATANVYMV